MNQFELRTPNNGNIRSPLTLFPRIKTPLEESTATSDCYSYSTVKDTQCSKQKTSYIPKQESNAFITATMKAVRLISSVSAGRSQRTRHFSRVVLAERHSSSASPASPSYLGVSRRQSQSSLATLDTDSSEDEPPEHTNRLEALREKLRQEEHVGPLANSNSRKPTSSVWQQRKAPAGVQVTSTTSTTTSVDKEEAFVDYQKLADSLPDPPAPDKMGILTDRFARQHTYLRISLTEKCNLRCTYCMPAEGVPLQAAASLLQTDEILQLAKHFTVAGVKKFRLTGGEPTLRKDIVDIVAGLSALNPDLIGMTTNGITLTKQLPDLVDAGLSSMNLSLDTLDPDKFATLTRRPPTYFHKVMQALQMAVSDYGTTGTTGKYLTTKLNCVVQRGVNDNEIADFIALTDPDQFPGLQVRFIEYMPFSENGWNQQKLVPYLELLENLKVQHDVHLTAEASADPHDTTKWFRTESGGKIGFITSMSSHFCAGCNRLRLGADGQIKVCLFDGSSTISLRDGLRQGLNESDMHKLIYTAVQTKKYALGGHKDPEAISKDSANNKPMTLIGG
jgi:molybdenum cofactor biosynthesis protein A